MMLDYKAIEIAITLLSAAITVICFSLLPYKVSQVMKNNIGLITVLATIDVFLIFTIILYNIFLLIA